MPTDRSSDRFRDRTELRPEVVPTRNGDGELRGSPGTMIGSRYALRTAIGHGGMGTVWRATDTLLRRDVAVKEVLLPQGMAASDRDAMYQRTLREARAAAALSHPAVVQVYDVVTDGGRPWIVMELLQARSLAEIIVEDGPLAPRAVAKIGIALLGALEMAHAAGVLHRDVKPANVLICNDGRCVLTDFGVARMPADSQLTTPGMVLGSPHFISPERAIGAPFGPPSDLFSLGVTLYTAVEGRPPFDKPDPIETMRAVVEEQPAPSMRAGALVGVLAGLLEKDPARRWDVPRARAVLRELLSGALASNATTHQTDPYAVVRPVPYTPPTAPSAPSGQIGGPAMLAPGESLSGAIRRRQSTAPRPPAQRSPVEAEGADPGSALPPTGGFPAPTGAFPGSAAGAPTGQVYGAAGQPTPSARPGGHAQRGAALLAGAGALTRQVSERAATAYRGLPPKGRVAVLAGAVVGVLVLGIIVGTTMFGGSAPAPPAAKPSATPNQPLIPVQEYRDPKGVAVNVPAGWRQSQPKSATYMDFIDPANPDRWVRVSVSRSNEATGRKALESAARRFQSTSASANGSCQGYQQVQLADTRLAGYDGAVFEYTCAPPGKAPRRGRWTAIVVNGMKYEITLSAPAATFDDSKKIEDEMVRSFRLSA
ncbi:protein kinase [Planosporangium mesophilum]|nr:protein kinase [Planosporangium mesophilum]